MTPSEWPVMMRNLTEKQWDVIKQTCEIDVPTEGRFMGKVVIQRNSDRKVGTGRTAFIAYQDLCS